MAKIVITDKKQRAQAFILIAIVALAIIAVIVLLSIQGTRVRASPTVQEAFWQVDGSHVGTAVVGEEIRTLIPNSDSTEHLVLVKPTENKADTENKISEWCHRIRSS